MCRLTCYGCRTSNTYTGRLLGVLRRYCSYCRVTTWHNAERDSTLSPVKGATMALYVQEAYFSREGDKLSYLGDNGMTETRYDTPGALYRFLQSEYGRCTSKLHIDTQGGPKHIGWCFERRERYEDAPQKTYVRQVWVTVHTALPERATTYHYQYLD